MTRPIGSGTTALVLAGGFGTRLRECVSDRPKVLAEVAGRPFLAHVLDPLVACGVRRVVLCTGYLGEQIEAEFGASFSSAEILYSHEDEPLGTGGALVHAVAHVETERVLVVNGDSHCDASYSSFLTWCESVGPDAALIAVEVPDGSRFGQIEFDGDTRVASFREKGAVEKGAVMGPAVINAGVYQFTSATVRRFPRTTPLSLELEVLPSLLASTGLHAWRTNGRFIDIGTTESYRDADAFFAAEVLA